MWALSVNDAILCFKNHKDDEIIVIDLDHDAGDYASDGGDYIRFLDWLEEQGVVDHRFYFHFHSKNPVGVRNMRAILRKNGWTEFTYPNN
jgi:hypothetical protein